MMHLIWDGLGERCSCRWSSYFFPPSRRESRQGSMMSRDRWHIADWIRLPVMILGESTWESTLTRTQGKQDLSETRSQRKVHRRRANRQRRMARRANCQLQRMHRRLGLGIRRGRGQSAKDALGPLRKGDAYPLQGAAERDIGHS